MDLAEANRRGQQLFIADLFFRAGQRTEKPPRPVPEPVRRLEPHQQLTLFTMPRDLAAHGRQGLLSRPVVPQIAAFMEACLHTYARDHAWPPRILDDVWYGLRILLGLQDHPGAPIKASDVLALRGVDLPVRRTLEVLAAADMLDDDRRSHIEGWFETRIVDLPPQMAEEMQIWFDVMRHGSTSSPRRNPRTITTIYLHTRWTLPTLKVWAEQGHASLREISRSDVLQVLPPSGNPRATLGQGLKSIFGVLKARKVVFLNPTAHLHAGFATPGQPMPLDPQVVRAALDSPDPVRAALVALTAFHGLRPGQLRTLLLADLHDGRLTIGNRSILLAQPVMQRLAAYLAYRNARWPGSPNPHLFIHFRTASRTEPPGPRWVRLIVGPGITAQSLREDRILDEVTATGGDARRLCDLFGISITAATRYTNTVNHPDLGTAHD